MTNCSDTFDETLGEAIVLLTAAAVVVVVVVVVVATVAGVDGGMKRTSTRMWT